MSLERTQNANPEVVETGQKNLSDWAIAKMLAVPKEYSLFTFNAHNHMKIELLRVGIQNIKNKRFQTEAKNKRKSIERSVQRFAVNTEIENRFLTMIVILQKLIPLSMEMNISTRTT